MTIFIGGNHEASNYLREMFYGGWAAPNIYFLGSSGVIDVELPNCESITIGGISGIEQYHDYKKGFFESMPLNKHNEIKSIYHYREFEIEKMKFIWNLSNIYGKPKPIDMFLIQEWPSMVT